MTTVVFKVSVELTPSDMTDYITIRDNIAQAIHQYRLDAGLTALNDEDTEIQSVIVSYEHD